MHEQTQPQQTNKRTSRNMKLTTTTLSASKLGSSESDRADILKQGCVGVGVGENNLGTVEVKVELAGVSRNIECGGHVW
jgi:hypothetical protein